MVIDLFHYFAETMLLPQPIALEIVANVVFQIIPLAAPIGYAGKTLAFGKRKRGKSAGRDVCNHVVAGKFQPAVGTVHVNRAVAEFLNEFARRANVEEIALSGSDVHVKRRIAAKQHFGEFIVYVAGNRKFRHAPRSRSIDEQDACINEVEAVFKLRLLQEADDTVRKTAAIFANDIDSVSAGYISRSLERNARDARSGKIHSLALKDRQHVAGYDKNAFVRQRKARHRFDYVI